MECRWFLITKSKLQHLPVTLNCYLELGPQEIQSKQAGEFFSHPYTERGTLQGWYWLT